MKKSFILLIAILGLTLSARAADPKDILGTLGGMVSNAVASKNFSVDDIVGTWKYTGPAVGFASDNALKKIGGAAASATVENKLEPYYKKLGLTNVTFVIAEDHTFTMSFGKVNLKGKIEKADDGNLTFSFNALGKVPLGKVSAMATKAGNTLNLTFDATRLIQILSKVASIAKNTGLSSITKLLESYDGIYMGFKLKKA